MKLMPDSPADQTFLGYYLFRLAGTLLPRIPVQIAYPVALWIGDLYYWLSPGRRNNVAINISHALGKPPESPAVKRVVRQVCRNLALNFYDMFRVPYLTKDQIAELIEIEGWTYVEAALELAQGIVFVTPHFGNLDVVMQTAAVRSLPITIPAERLRPEKLFRYVCSLRGCHGMLRFVPVDGPLLELFRALHRGEAVALAADRDITNSGRWVSFFEAPARLPDGHVRLALRTGAAMIAGFSYRQPKGRFLVRLCPVPLDRTAGNRASIDQGMMTLVALLEEYIRADPGQWVLTVPLWDRPYQPRGSEDEDSLDLTL